MPVSLLWKKALQVLATLLLSSQRMQKKKMDGFPANLRSAVEGNAGYLSCAEFRIKESLPAWFYLLTRPGAQQFEITNNNKEARFRTHARFGWFEAEVFGPYPGEQVLATERKL